VADVNDIPHRGTAYLLLRFQGVRALAKEGVKNNVDEMIRLGWRCSTEVYSEIISLPG
jgi:hypothetical protein